MRLQDFTSTVTCLLLLVAADASATSARVRTRHARGAPAMIRTVLRVVAFVLLVVLGAMAAGFALLVALVSATAIRL